MRMAESVAVNTVPPAWARLLRNYKRKPTLPFIIGGLREFASVIDPQGDSFEQVRELLEEMESYRLSDDNRQIVCVQRCGQLAVPVFSIVTEEYKPYSRACFPSRAKGKTRLCFSTELEELGGVELGEVADRLFHGYEHPAALDLHHYSHDPDNMNWRAFDEEDRASIEAALCT